MTFKRLIHALLIGMLALCTSLPASAAMVGTAELQSGATPAIADSGGQRNWIREQLVAGGVDAALAERRVLAMTDAQVAEIHQRLEQVPAGGSSGLVILILILVITEIMGYTDIVPGWPAR